MSKLSVNINKIATLRNARGGSQPNVLEAAINCIKFGADGITVHPRPDARHITYDDVREISNNIDKEFNVEGYPNPSFLALVKEVRPQQVTLVPDSPDVLTSNAGWDTVKHFDMLSDIIGELQSLGMRVSLFVDPDVKMVESAALCRTDRIELYTESYAVNYEQDRKAAVEPFIAASRKAKECNLGLNAGHDLNLKNLRYFSQNMIDLDEVSIGHAIISDSLYLGLENTIRMYKRELLDQ